MNNVEKFDPSSLMQGVKDRVKATFVSLIPDPQWEEMVQKEIDAFFAPQTMTFTERDKYKDGAYSSTRYAVVDMEMSPFRMLVWEHCTDMTKTVLKNKIDQEYFEGNWGGYETKEKLKEIISEAAPLAAAKFFESISLGLMQDLQHKIHNAGYR